MSEKKNNFDEMTDHELLAEIVRYNQKRSMLLTVLLITAITALAAIAVSMAVMIPKMNATAETINQLAEQGSVSLEKLDKIDIEKLNSAINDFSIVAAKLSQWFK